MSLNVEHGMLLVDPGGQLHGDHRQTTVAERCQDVGVSRRYHYRLDGHVQRNVKYGLQSEIY